MNLTEIKKALLALKEEAPDKTPTKKDIVREYIEYIIDLRIEGHSYESISNALKSVEVDISVPTLRSYLSSLRKRRRNRKLTSTTIRASPAVPPMIAQHNKVMAPDSARNKGHISHQSGFVSSSLTIPNTGSQSSDFSQDILDDTIK